MSLLLSSSVVVLAALCVDSNPKHTFHHRSLIFHLHMHLCCQYWLAKNSDLYFLVVIFFSLFSCPPHMVRLRASGTIMHLFWDYPHKQNYASVTNIFKLKLGALGVMLHLSYIVYQHLYLFVKMSNDLRPIRNYVF